MLEQVLYRAHIVNYPEFEEYYAFDNQRPHVDDELWERPVGWEPIPEYVDRFQSDKFFEPDTRKWFKSRSSAKSRVDALNAMGYDAIVQRSAPVEWPDGDALKVSKSEGQRVREAIRVLKDAGLISSADELLS